MSRASTWAIVAGVAAMILSRGAVFPASALPASQITTPIGVDPSN